jgi:regulatory subunit for Cdc7p protein kinase
MATIMRHPLTTRHQDQLPAASQSSRVQALQSLQSISTNKRPRSPDADETILVKLKRVKSGTSQPTSLKNATPHATNQREMKERKERLREKEERQQAKEEFIAKYTKAFPSFVFYFDERDGSIRQLAESRVLALGAVCFLFSLFLVHLVDSRGRGLSFFSLPP